MSGRHLRRALFAGIATAGVGVGSYYVLLTGQPASLFSPVLSTVCVLQRPFTGLNIAFDDVSGNLSDGRLDFKNFRVKWRNGGWLSGVSRKVDCDLTMTRFSVDMGDEVANMVLRDAKSLATRIDSLDDAAEVHIPHVEAQGVKGDCTILIRNPQTPLPNIVFDHLSLQDVNVVVGDGFKREKPLVFPPLDVRSLELKPYRLRKPINSALFHASGNGSVGQKPFSISSTPKTRQLVAQVPVEFISSFLRPPLSWVKEGHVEVKVKLDPSTKKSGAWIAETSLTFSDGLLVQAPAPSTEEKDVYQQAAGQIVSVLSKNGVSVTAREEVLEDPKNEDQFISEMGQKYALLVLTKAGAAAISSIKEKASSWF